MKRNYYVKVIKEEYVRNRYKERVLANFKSISDGVKFLEEIAGSCGFKRIYDGATEYTFARGEEYIFLEECEDRVYETFEEYMKVFDNLYEIKEMLEERGIIVEHHGDSLLIRYKFGHYFEVNGFVTKEEVEQLLIKYNVA